MFLRGVSRLWQRTRRHSQMIISFTRGSVKKVSGLAFPRLECLTNVAGRWKAIFLSSETSKWTLDTHPAP